MNHNLKRVKYKFLSLLFAFGAVCQLGGCAIAAGDLGAMAAAAAGVPQMNAFLPNKAAVVASEPTAIDGIWTISSIGKKIRIEGGRAYAVDGWLHAFTLKVQPDMVVVKNITATGRGKFAGDDLPLMAKVTYEIQPSAQLSVLASTLTGPVRFALIPVSIDNPRRYQSELRKLGFSSVNLPRTPATYLASRDQYESPSDEDDYDDYDEDDYDEDESDDDWEDDYEG